MCVCVCVCVCLSVRLSVCLCKINVLFSNEIQTFPVSDFLSFVADGQNVFCEDELVGEFKS